MRRFTMLIAAMLALSGVPVAEALDFSGYARKEVDWKDAQIADPPAVLKSFLGGGRARSVVLRRPIVIDRPGVYDYRNVIHIARFSEECDQQEGRRPMLQVRCGGVTVRNWIGLGTGHDGIHVHSGRGQGWTSRAKLSKVRFERCWQQACEDALTVGFGTSQISFHLCGFIPNPNGEFRDKLVQLNHADQVTFSRCYFGPTKNGVEFKSGADLLLKDSVFDHCSTGLRVHTSDAYGGIRANRPTRLRTEACRFHHCHHPAYLDGTVRWESHDDRFEHTIRVVRKNGAKFEKR